VLVTVGRDTIPTDRLRFYTASAFFAVDPVGSVRGLLRGTGEVRVVVLTGAAADQPPEASFPVKVIGASVRILPPIDTVLQPGETAVLGYTLTDSAGTSISDTTTVQWSSLDPSIAAIDSSGQVTPGMPGAARFVVELLWDSISSDQRGVAVTDSAGVLRFADDPYNSALVEHMASPLREAVRSHLDSARQAVSGENVLAADRHLLRADSLMTMTTPASTDGVFSAVGRLFVRFARSKNSGAW
jgi:hypothetical protein